MSSPASASMAVATAQRITRRARRLEAYDRPWSADLTSLVWPVPAGGRADRVRASFGQSVARLRSAWFKQSIHYLGSLCQRRPDVVAVDALSDMRDRFRLTANGVEIVEPLVTQPPATSMLRVA